MTFRLNPEETPLVILSEGCFGEPASKTATGVIRYGNWPITAVIDSRYNGETTVPVVATLSEAFTLLPKPKAMLIGTAPMGGGLPEDYKAVVIEAIQAGLHIISGLHIFLNDMPDIQALANKHGVRLWDVRYVAPNNLITRQLARPSKTKVITMVGSDCSVGKMFTALELTQALKKAGYKAEFVATGQTGIMISGHGVPLDRVIGDFMAGTLEAEIDRVIQAYHPDFVVVEGQGSLLHPAYSGVTLSLLHGSAPDAMVLCHNPKLQGIRNFEHIAIPSWPKLINLYETATGWIKPAKIAGISLNTSSFDAKQAQAFIDDAHQQTHLPVTDPVRFGIEDIMQAIIN